MVGTESANKQISSNTVANQKESGLSEPVAIVSHKWDSYKVRDFRRELKCDALFSKPRPVHSQSVWRDARRTYARIVGPEASTVGDLDASHNAFLVEGIKADQAGGKGRGIFATVDIPAGALMYDFRRTAQFRDGQDYRRFIMGIPADVACDVLQWAYVQYIGVAPAEEEEYEKKNLRIMVDLDEGSFCNNGGRKNANFGYIDEKVEPIHNGVRPHYAKRNIVAGEELLCNYSEFSEGDWESFGV